MVSTSRPIIKESKPRWPMRVMIATGLLEVQLWFRGLFWTIEHALRCIIKGNMPQVTQKNIPQTDKNAPGSIFWSNTHIDNITTEFKSLKITTRK